MNPKSISFIQIAFKSRNVCIGDRLIPSIQSRQAQIVFANELCGNNRKKKLKDKCAFYRIPYYEIPAQDFDRITRQNIQSFSVTDPELSRVIEEHMKG